MLQAFGSGRSDVQLFDNLSRFQIRNAFNPGRRIRGARPILNV